MIDLLFQEDVPEKMLPLFWINIWVHNPPLTGPTWNFKLKKVGLWQ